MNWKINEVRKDFPILDQQVNGERLAYLDNAATMQQSRPVTDAVLHYYQTTHSNVHRGVYTLSNQATDMYEQAREKVAHFINTESSEQIVFTRSTTESLNLVAQGFGDAVVNPGDEIVISVAEHHSNLIPWQQLASRRSAHLKYIELNEDGSFDMDSATRVITKKTKIVAVAHVGNVIGIQNPINKLEQLAHKVNAYLVVDGAQAVSHMAVDVQELNADFYAFSGHKLGAPTGIGVLFGKSNLLAKMNPVQFGGEMISKVTRDVATWKKTPLKFEAGTPNISGAIGLGVAIDYVQKMGLKSIQDYEEKLMQRMLTGIEGISGVTIYGPHNTKKRLGVLSFNIDGVHPHDVATGLDLLGIEVRAGHHCAQPLMQDLGVAATARASIAFYNNMADVDQLIDGVKQVKEFFLHES
ncbi:cysteine desulfurase [Pediococcus claussenii]|uniref:cysteine desulfurase n=1 Tax=Pediococcus claussenii (strain ATCC BAA-344 / DSM 14800 / JCM 18046 / KCTC 3811 / LMG 21948 / P06) TaxID=701521 RepID=G8PAC5_PEDCP|nr:cysteine desulfurase [Pediococcus claussenii]AEV94564.1 cysteine desulfurase SufS [Pediococcus claussenii ATCC BAA-344]ANZ69779.1 cysteine desulfurase [Pediococcus claussenii]ANZ71596.1 cysteine desulfurase [Pediococcus claussenii]KRN19730.1 sufS protein [Pediococcus claussenii]